MPACLSTGINTGVMISTVGVKSSAVPTISTMIISAKVSSILLPISGCTRSASCCGMFAVVISHAETPAADTKNMMTAVVSAAR